MFCSAEGKVILRARIRKSAGKRAKSKFESAHRTSQRLHYRAAQRKLSTKHTHKLSRTATDEEAGMSSMIGYQLHDDSASDAEAIARNASQQLDELLQEALACANKTTRLRKELSEVQGQVSVLCAACCCGRTKHSLSNLNNRCSASSEKTKR